MSKVRIHTGLGAGVIKNNFASAYRIYTFMRYLDTHGSGCLQRRYIIEKAVSIGLSEDRTRQILRKGMDLFWIDSGEGYFRLISAYRIAQRFGVKVGDLVKVPIENLTNGVMFKASIYQSWFSKATLKQNGLSVSRETIKKYFGISPVTQRKYEHITDMAVEEQYVRDYLYRKFPQRIDFFGDYETESPVKHEAVWNVGDGIVIYQHVNRYNTTDEKVEFIRNDNKRMKRYLGTPVYSGRGDPTAFKRSYYCNDLDHARKVLRKRGRSKVFGFIGSYDHSSRGRGRLLRRVRY